MGKIVLYVPVGGYPSTADIARGSAIIGEPRAGVAEVEVYFEGAIFGQENMRTLADRAAHAAGRMLERYATTATRIIPRDALVAVGTLDFGEGRISLTGADSEDAVAAWLGTLRLAQEQPQRQNRKQTERRQQTSQRVVNMSVLDVGYLPVASEVMEQKSGAISLQLTRREVANRPFWRTTLARFGSRGRQIPKLAPIPLSVPHEGNQRVSG